MGFMVPEPLDALSEVQCLLTLSNKLSNTADVGHGWRWAMTSAIALKGQPDSRAEQLEQLRRQMAAVSGWWRQMASRRAGRR